MKLEDVYHPYGQCLYPTIEIKINQTNISVSCSTLHISLSMKQKAGSATIQYEFEQEEKLSEVKKACKLGAVINVSLGYSQVTKPVFFGYLHTVEIKRTSTGFTLELYAQDVFGLMMNNQRLSYYKGKTAQTVLEDIAKASDYKSFIKKRAISKSKDDERTFTQWKESDFATICLICECKGMQFYMRHHELVVEPLGTTMSQALSFTAFGLEEVTLRSSAADVFGKITIYGRDENIKTIQKEKKVAFNNAAIISSTFSSLSYIDRYEQSSTKDQLSNRTKIIEKQIKQSMEIIEFTSIYVPELVCGRKLDFTRVSAIGKSCMLQELDIIYEDTSFMAHGIGVVV